MAANASTDRIHTSGWWALIHRDHRVLAWLVLLTAIAGSIYFAATVPVLPYDDAYITLRYVRNLLDGHGLVYNPSEHVFGATCPLYVLILAGVGKLLPNVPLETLAVRLNVVPFVGMGLLAFALLRQWTGRYWVAAGGAAALLLNARLLAIGAGGMEAYFFVCFVLACLHQANAKRSALAGFLAGLATLTRPEGVLLIPILAWVFRHGRKHLLVGGASYGLATLPWAAFAWFYYGSIIPQSVKAKAAPLYPLEPGTAMRDMIMRFGYPGFEYLVFGGIVAAGVLLLVRVARDPAWGRTRHRAWMPLAFFGLLFLFYAVSNPLLFDWYWPALEVSAFLVALCGLVAAGDWIIARLAQHRARPVPAWITVTSKCCVLIVLAGWTMYPHKKYSLERMVVSKRNLRTLAYREAARRIAEQGSAADTVATTEIGALGFWHPGRILDCCGLVSPEAMRYLPVRDDQRVAPWAGAFPVELIEEQRPEWVVSMPYFCDASLIPSAWFQQNYVLADRVPLPKKLWRSSEVLVFRRVHPDSQQLVLNQ